MGALKEITRAADHYDYVVIVRGGGSRLDLSGFDSFEIGKSIAQCPLPVLTGIGHEIDQSVADVVAHTSLKTPTAAADHLVELMLDFEYQLDNAYQGIRQISQRRVASARQNIAYAVSALGYAPRQLITGQHSRLDHILPRLTRLARERLRTSQLQIQNAEAITKAIEPSRVIARGFSITRVDGRILKDPKKVKEGAELVTELSGGTIKSSAIK